MMKPSATPPIFLNLLQIRLPLGGVLSILHRISGVLLFLAIPLIIYLLQLLNGSENSFVQVQAYMQSLPGKIVSSIIVWLLIQHTMSGIRHLLMDLDYSYDRRTARITALLAFALSFLLIVITGALIWL